MKKTPILIFIILITKICLGQITFENDSILKKMKSQIPNGWTMTINNSILFIEKTDSVRFIFNPNPDIINGPAPQNYRGKYKISYRLEPKWTSQKRTQTRLTNDSINKEIEKLWGKYQVEKFYLLDPNSMSKEGPIKKFQPKTKDDSLKLKKYLAEKELLESQYVIYIPDKCTEKYSLFDYYINYHYTTIIPANAMDEIKKVTEMINKFCVCYN
jgi:hypothetical protein